MDAPLYVFVNGASGSREVEQLAELLERNIPASRRGGVFLAEHPDDIEATMRRAIDGCKAANGVLTLAGGDGTLNSVLDTAVREQLTLGLIPRGTFNYFARAHGIEVEPEAALAQLLAAEPTTLPVCWLNDRPFLINASVGLYPEVIAERERHQQLAGRSRPTALISGLITLLRRNRAFAVQVTADGESRAVRTSLVFITHNRTQLEALKLTDHGCLEQGKFALLVLRRLSLLEKFSLLVDSVRGRLAEHDRLDYQCATEVELRMRKTLWPVALDGELKQCRQPLNIRIQPGALRFMLPATPP